jgi:Flp pilus assembly protein TadG
LGRLKKDEGSTLVEYAVVFILLITMVFGIIGFGDALYSYSFVNHAAREATRWAAVNGANCKTDSSCGAPAKASDVQTYVTNIAPPGIDSSKVTATATWPSSTGVCSTTSNAPGCKVNVQVSYSFHFNVPLIRTSALTLSSSSEMVISH